jgi:hypothetical protein
MAKRILFDRTLVHLLASARRFVGHGYNAHNLVMASMEFI